MFNQTSTLIIVLVLLVAFIVVFILFNFFSERKKKKKIIKEKERIKEEEVKFILKTSARVNAIIELNNQLLDEFQVSIGDFKMSQINNLAKNALDYIYIQEQFQDIFIRNPFEKDELFLASFVQLMNLKSNLWTKNHKELLSYFSSLKTKYLSEEANKEEFTKYQNSFLEIYQEFINQVKSKNKEVTELFNTFKEKDEAERLEYLRSVEQEQPKTVFNKVKNFLKFKK